MEIVAATAFAIGNLGSKLGAVEQRVCAITDTRRIIIVSVVVGESTPLGSSIDDTITNDKTARAANQITRRELLHKVGRELLTVLAHGSHVQILAPFCRNTLLDQRLLDHRRGHHLGLVRLRPIDVIELVEDGAVWFALPSFFPLARYNGTSLCIRSGLLVEELGGNLDEEFGIQFGGIDRDSAISIVDALGGSPSALHF
jgi:hypothetical protein